MNQSNHSPTPQDEVKITISGDNAAGEHGFVEIALTRTWQCLKPGHSTHTMKNMLRIRMSELPELARQIDAVLAKVGAK